MVKTLWFLIILLFLSACTDAVSTENGEISSHPLEEDEIIIDVGSDYATTDDAEMPVYFVEDTADEYEEFSYNETFDIYEITSQPFIQYPSYQFHMKYWFSFSPPDIEDEIGHVITNWGKPPWPVEDWWLYEPAVPGRISSDRAHEIFIADDGRIIVPGSSGWPGPLRDTAYDVDENLEIRVTLRDTISDDDNVVLSSRLGVLTQIPELWEDNFSNNLLIGRAIEVQTILYEERENSKLWQWLMDEENTWRITVNDPRPFSDIFQDISGSLWNTHGIQIFLYAGDATIMSRRGILSQIPELQEDNLYFDLYIGGGFEMQYIMLHEQPESKLWQLMVELRK